MSTDNQSSSRDAILGKVRVALKANSGDRAREIIVNNRLRGHSRNLIPSRAALPRDALKSLFKSTLETQSASVVHIASVNKLALAVGRYLASHNLEKTVSTGTEPLFDGLNWDGALVTRKLNHTKVPPRGGSSEPTSGDAARGEDRASLSHAVAGVGETGTLFLLSGASNPTSLNFLPEHHIVVVRGRDIVGCYEEAWDRIRKLSETEQKGEVQLPRTVNLISGPSRTGDIEQTIIMGAHGPRFLHVIIIDED